MYGLICLDLDNTLLRSDRTISDYTLDVLARCQACGALVAFCTARGESNARTLIAAAQPDVVISSGGALIRLHGAVIHSRMFTAEQTHALIEAGRRIAGADCEITVDAPDAYYWNYKVDPLIADSAWGDTIYTDYSDFAIPALKICVELPRTDMAEHVAAAVPDCDYSKFSDSDWHKFTPTGATKGDAIHELCRHIGILPAQAIAFGDDLGDMDMFGACGLGVAMGNALPEVKAKADDVADTNDNDGMAKYLERLLECGKVGTACV